MERVANNISDGPMKFCIKCGKSCIPTMVICAACGSREFSDVSRKKQNTGKKNYSENIFLYSNFSKEYLKEKNIIYALAFILCITAIFPMPYGFYILLRLVVTFVAVISALELKKEVNQFWYFFVGVAVLFNPLFPIYLSKSVWVPIDLIVAGSFAWMIFRQKSN